MPSVLEVRLGTASNVQFLKKCKPLTKGGRGGSRPEIQLFQVLGDIDLF